MAPYQVIGPIARQIRVCDKRGVIGRYTAFGRVVHGQDVVDVIQQGDVVFKATVTKDG